MLKRSLNLLFLGMLVGTAGLQTAFGTLSDQPVACDRIFLPKSFDSEVSRVYGVHRFTSQLKAKPGWYIYLWDRNRLVFAPRDYPKKGRNETLFQKHSDLFFNEGFKSVQGAGEFLIGSDGLISTVNNRSGTFRPSDRNLEAFSVWLKSKSLVTKRVQMDDYSKVGREHPNYVENPYLDELHTIALVEKIGKKKFSSLLREQNPIAALSGAMGRPIVLGEGSDSGQEISEAMLRTWVLENGEEVERWGDLKRESRDLGSPVEFSRFLKVAQEYRKVRVFYVDDDDFDRSLKSWVALGDELDLEFTALSVTQQVRLNKKVYLVPFKLVAVGYSKGKLVSNTEYHKEILYGWLWELGWEDGEVYEFDRSGYFIKKRKGDKSIDIWYVDKYQFRFGGPDPKPHYSIDLR